MQEDVNPRVLDISHHNWDDHGPLDWDSIVRSGIWGIIHKATEDIDYMDPYYQRAIAEASGHGLLVGAYHFFRPGNIIEQADHFLRVVRPTRDTLIVLDHEDEGCSLDDVKEWMRYVQTRTGQQPALYSGHVLKEQIGDGRDEYLARSRLWIAEYNAKPTWPPNWDELWLWQFTDGIVGPMPHTIPGVGSVDINSYSGSKKTLQQTWSTSMRPDRPERPGRPDKPQRPPDVVKPPEPDGEPAPWLQVMRAMTGLTEGSGSADNPKILGMRNYIAAKWPDMAEYCSYYKHDDTPWCGLCSAFCVSVADIRPPFGPTDTDRFLWALSWSDGRDAAGFITLDEPRQGCIVVTERDGGGHVTMFEHMEGGKYMCRGGNQSDSINVTAIDPSTVVALMWPTKLGVEISADVPPAFPEWMQASLNLLGAKPPLDIDGEFGPASKSALQKFQKDNKLAPTGVPDQDTTGAMLEELQKLNDDRGLDEDDDD